MARHVFFSFHYQHDITRVNVVRNHWVTKLNGKEAGYWDASLTAVLAGARTARRKWVTYEIVQSHDRGNGIICVYINRIKNLRGLTDTRGRNPLDDVYIEEDDRCTHLSEVYPV